MAYGRRQSGSSFMTISDGLGSRCGESMYLLHSYWKHLSDGANESTAVSRFAS
jgi:hypothetical protein